LEEILKLFLPSDAALQPIHRDFPYEVDPHSIKTLLPTSWLCLICTSQYDDLLLV